MTRLEVEDDKAFRDQSLEARVALELAQQRDALFLQFTLHLVGTRAVAASARDVLSHLPEKFMVFMILLARISFGSRRIL